MHLLDAVHRSIEQLLGLPATVVQPAVARILALAVRRFRSPAEVPPKNWLVDQAVLNYVPVSTP